MIQWGLWFALIAGLGACTDTGDTQSAGEEGAYVVVDTNQTACYDARQEITCPLEGNAFFGQDAQHNGVQPAYRENGDDTVFDLNTGLMWQKGYQAEKLSYEEALAGASTFNAGGYDDWRLPTIKELYSLIMFNGEDPSSYEGTDTSGLTPFIDTAYFDFRYGLTDEGERIIDAQYASSTEYVWTTMDGDHTLFGVNFADGRIKGYGTVMPFGPAVAKTFEVKYVRGNVQYGVNVFVGNADGTVSDTATGLMWTLEDSATGLDWNQALTWAEEKNAESHLGYSDWRLPNVKELQSIVDYTRSPDTTSSPAIDPLFHSTSIVNEGGETDYPCYWSNTTHAAENGMGGAAAYVCFGRALGYMDGWKDVHGAGAQRSDPKTGDPTDYPTGHGPQGDAVRIFNYVRLTRNTDNGV
ncbi:MAG: DUF1566 domain-containing protein [Proteobacteria bacterium]|nr:DUF1566 domain-containing protein [Pseudomonadota bacterium]